MNSNIPWEKKQSTAPHSDNSNPDAASVQPQEGEADVTQIAAEATAPPSPDSDATQVAEQNDDAPLEVGDIVSERYELLELLGEGGMGRVFLANDLVFALEYKDKNSKVAIKVLNQRFSRHKSARLAMQREARKSRSLSHPNVVSVHHFDSHGAHAYMIMEYIEGQPLNTWIREYAAEGLSLEEAMGLIEGMALGLDYIHSQQLVHCDFKPGNIFVTGDNAVKVLDLGIARASEGLEGEPDSRDETEFDAGSLGALTPAYASCEQFEGVPPSPSDDVYALACITYQLLAGRHPYGGAPAVKARQQQLRPEPIGELGKRRWQVLERALAFSRKDRTCSTAEFLRDLKGDKHRGKRLLTVVAGVALLGIAGTAISMRMAMQPMDADEQWLMSLKPATSAPLSLQEEQRMERWLAQGTAYLTIANEEFDRGDLTTAHHILKGGADNAYWALSHVTERVDSPEARQGLLGIVKSYARWATALAEEQPQEAMWTLCQGMALHPEHAAFKKLSRQLTRKLSTTAGAVTDCATLIKLGTPPAPLGGGPSPYAQGGAL